MQISEFLREIKRIGNFLRNHRMVFFEEFFPKIYKFRDFRRAIGFCEKGGFRHSFGFDKDLNTIV